MCDMHAVKEGKGREGKGREGGMVETYMTETTVLMSHCAAIFASHSASAWCGVIKECHVMRAHA